MNKKHGPNDGLFIRVANEATSGCLKFVFVIALIIISMPILSMCSREKKHNTNSVNINSTNVKKNTVENELLSIIEYSKGIIVNIGTKEKSWSNVSVTLKSNYWGYTSVEEKESFVIGTSQSLKKILVKTGKLKEDSFFVVTFYNSGFKLAHTIVPSTPYDTQRVTLY